MSFKDCNSSLRELPSRATPRTAKNLATAAVMTVLPADPNKHYHLYKAILSTDLAGTYTLKMGNDEVGSFFLGATAGFVVDFVPFYTATGNINEAVTLTKPAGANTSVTTFAGLV